MTPACPPPVLPENRTAIYQSTRSARAINSVAPARFTENTAIAFRYARRNLFSPPWRILHTAVGQLSQTTDIARCGNGSGTEIRQRKLSNRRAPIRPRERDPFRLQRCQRQSSSHERSGLDLEGKWLLVKRVSMWANYSYLDARFRSAVLNGIDVSGNRIPPGAASHGQCGDRVVHR